MLVVAIQDVPYPTSFLSILYLLFCFFSLLTSVCAVFVLQPHYQILNYTGLYIMYIIVCFLLCLCSLCILCLCMLNVRKPTSGLRAIRNPR